MEIELTFKQNSQVSCKLDSAFYKKNHSNSKRCNYYQKQKQHKLLHKLSKEKKEGLEKKPKIAFVLPMACLRKKNKFP